MIELSQINLNPDERILFHVTSKTFTAFDDQHIGTGNDNNSSLGFFFSDNPEDVALYLTPNRLLKIVKVVIEKPVYDLNYYDVFGKFINDINQKSKKEFAQMRQDLIQGGFDAIEYEDHEEHMVISLDANKISIVAIFEHEEAQSLCLKMVEANAGNIDEDRLSILKLFVDQNNLAANVP